MIAFDSEGIIRIWNLGAERIFGYTADEAVGRSLDIIKSERLRKRPWEGCCKTMATGENRYGVA